VDFAGRRVPVVMQNQNGPCPLLGIVNGLLLRGALQLRSPGAGEVTLEALLAMVAERLLDANARVLEGKDGLAANQQQNVADAINLLPKLATGVDVNPRYDSVTGFEFTNEIAIFDLLDMNIVHGWLIDPQHEAAGEVARRTYNQLVERMIDLQGKVAEAEAEGAQGHLGQEYLAEMKELMHIRGFLDESASQLTAHGLMCLHEALRDGEVAVLFRNNHFATILKRQGHLYVLVTDQGYAGEDKVVWECLSDVGGDTCLVDGDFIISKASSAQFARESAWADDAAAQAARLLSDVDFAAPSGQGSEGQAAVPGPSSEDHDFALALALQDELNAEAEQERRALRAQQAAAQQQQREPQPAQQVPHQPQRGPGAQGPGGDSFADRFRRQGSREGQKKSKDCAIM